jgi:hypothetical protein
MWYLGLADYLKEDRGITVDEIVFLYENKITQEVKEFVVTYDFAYIEPEWDMLHDLRDALETSEVPERPIWAGTEVTTCKNCPFFDHCWNENEENIPKRKVKYVQRRPRVAPTE